MESSEKPSKYHPIFKKFKTRTIKESVNLIFPTVFWVKKGEKTVFPVTQKFKRMTFQQSLNMEFRAKEIIILIF